MKAAAVFPRRKSLGVVERFSRTEARKPDRGKLRILNVGVCGTDREIACFPYGFPPPDGFGLPCAGT